MPHKKLTRDQAAEFLCLSKRTLEKWQERKRGPHFDRIGRQTYYYFDELKAWRDARESRRQLSR